MSFWGGSGSGSVDPCLCLMDQDPDPGIGILLFSSLTFKMPAKKYFFNTIFVCLLVFEATFKFKDKKSKRVTK
jgi:hypothetical protein